MVSLSPPSLNIFLVFLPNWFIDHFFYPFLLLPWDYRLTAESFSGIVTRLKLTVWSVSACMVSKKVTKKDKIVRAAVEIFAEKGFENTTTAEIKERAGVAQGTLFYHFKNKEGIILQIHRDIIELFYKSIESIPAERLTGLEAVESFLHKEEQFLQEHSLEVQVLFQDVTLAMLSNSSNDSCSPCKGQFIISMLEVLERFINKGIKDGSVRAVEAGKAAHLILSVVMGVGRYVMLSRPDAPDIFAMRNQMILSWLQVNGLGESLSLPV